MRDLAAMAGPPDPATCCQLCHGAATAALFTKGEQEFFKCTACGFQFSVSQENANLSQSFEHYEPAYRLYLEASPVDDVNHESTLSWLGRFVALDDPGVALLDVGTGSGKLLRYIRARRRCQTTGVEPSGALFRAFDLETLGVINSTLPLFAASARAAYDVVTVLDVVEHVADPLEFAASLHAVTKPGGYVFLSTPDASSVVARTLGRHWHHYNRYHLSLFDSRSIARLAQASGFIASGVEHRGKRFPLRYLRRYLRDFLLSAPLGSETTLSPGGWTVSLNLFDIISVVWRKP